MKELVSLLTCGLVDQHSSTHKRNNYELRNQGEQEDARHGRHHIHLFHRRHRSSESSSSKSRHAQDRPPVVPGSDYRINDQDLYRVDTDTTAPSQHTNLELRQEETDPDAMNHPVMVDTTLSPGFGVAR